jgi:hypothetical protein
MSQDNHSNRNYVQATLFFNGVKKEVDLSFEIYGDYSFLNNSNLVFNSKPVLDLKVDVDTPLPGDNFLLVDCGEGRFKMCSSEDPQKTLTELKKYEDTAVLLASCSYNKVFEEELRNQYNIKKICFHLNLEEIESLKLEIIKRRLSITEKENQVGPVPEPEASSRTKPEMSLVLETEINRSSSPVTIKRERSLTPNRERKPSFSPVRISLRTSTSLSPVSSTGASSLSEAIPSPEATSSTSSTEVTSFLATSSTSLPPVSSTSSTTSISSTTSTSSTPSPEVTPSTSPEATPSTSPEATPSTSPEATPSTSPEATPSTSPEATPSTSISSITEATPFAVTEVRMTEHKDLTELLGEEYCIGLITTQFSTFTSDTTVLLKKEKEETILYGCLREASIWENKTNLIFQNDFHVTENTLLSLGSYGSPHKSLSTKYKVSIQRPEIFFLSLPIKQRTLGERVTKFLSYKEKQLAYLSQLNLVYSDDSLSIYKKVNTAEAAKIYANGIQIGIETGWTYHYNIHRYEFDLKRLLPYFEGVRSIHSTLKNDYAKPIKNRLGSILAINAEIREEMRKQYREASHKGYTREADYVEVKRAAEKLKLV